MAKRSMFGDRRGTLAAAVTALLLLVGGALVVKVLAAPGAPPQPDTSQAQPTALPPAPGPGPAAGGSSKADPTSAGPTSARPTGSTPNGTSPAARANDFGPMLGPSDPVALRIPSIGVDTKGLVSLRLDRTGKLQAPTDFDRAGWYVGGPTPGEFGPAIIGAHVDSKAGPAVFFELGSLEKGAKVMVARKDGSTATFMVDRVARYSKADFPTRTVYGDTGGRAELRLITCGGAFDRATGHYVDNIVAFAHLVG